MNEKQPFQVTPNAHDVEAFCRRHGIIRLSFFGSAVRGDVAADSDVDVMVEFDRGRTPGLEFFTMHEELSEILGRDVDLLTRAEVEASENYIFRKHALRHVRTIFEG